MKKSVSVLAISAVFAAGLAAPQAASAKGLSAHTSTVRKTSAQLYFASESATLTASAKKALDAVAVELPSGWNFTVYGYVQLSRSHANDMRLSLRRARAVRAYLKAHGVTGSFRVRGIGLPASSRTLAKARLVTVTWNQVSPPHDCDVVFDAQGGTVGTSGALVTSGGLVSLPSATKAANVFLGWYTTTNDATNWSASAEDFVGLPDESRPVECDVDETVTLYAHWIAEPTPPGDDVPPVVAAEQSYSYQTAALPDSTVGTVTATDDVAVTTYRFSNGTDTSDNGWFQIHADGRITLTSSGFTSAANDFGAGSNSWPLSVQAGDAAGNWSSSTTVTVNELAPTPTPGFLVYHCYPNWWGNQIFDVWVPIAGSTYELNPVDPAQEWHYFKNGVEIAAPNRYPIPYDGTRFQGQMQWDGTSTWSLGDTLRVTVVFKGVLYQTPLFTLSNLNCA